MDCTSYIFLPLVFLLWLFDFTKKLKDHHEAKVCKLKLFYAVFLWYFLNNKRRTKDSVNYELTFYDAIMFWSRSENQDLYYCQYFLINSNKLSLTKFFQQFINK